MFAFCSATVPLLCEEAAAAPFFILLGDDVKKEVAVLLHGASSMANNIFLFTICHIY